jgi:hypothetical protein
MEGGWGIEVVCTRGLHLPAAGTTMCLAYIATMCGLRCHHSWPAPPLCDYLSTLPDHRSSLPVWGASIGDRGGAAPSAGKRGDIGGWWWVEEEERARGAWVGGWRKRMAWGRGRGLTGEGIRWTEGRMRNQLWWINFWGPWFLITISSIYKLLTVGDGFSSPAVLIEPTVIPHHQPFLQNHWWCRIMQ